jgi:hypothetical protein
MSSQRERRWRASFDSSDATPSSGRWSPATTTPDRSRTGRIGGDALVRLSPARTAARGQGRRLTAIWTFHILERRGVIESRREPMLIDDGSAAQEPALAALASAAVGGAAPAGPERRERPAIALRDVSGTRIASGLSVAEGGFSLHAATTAGADDAAGREALCKYVLRPPLAQERLRLLDDGLVRIELKRPFSDGTVAIDMDPLSLLCRLAAAVPPPSCTSSGTQVCSRLPINFARWLCHRLRMTTMSTRRKARISTRTVAKTHSIPQRIAVNIAHGLN